MDSYICTICGHVYSPDKGEPDMGIPPGIDFLQLPGDWKCPICRAAPGLFRRL